MFYGEGDVGVFLLSVLRERFQNVPSGKAQEDEGFLLSWVQFKFKLDPTSAPYGAAQQITKS